MKGTFALLLLMCVAGCTAAPTKPTTADLFDPSPEVFRRWKEDGNYYALLEIVDAYIDPWSHNKATKADVLRHLGHSSFPEYPNAGPKMWVFPSSRRVPYGAYLVVHFDDDDKVKEIEWVSE